MEINTNKGLSDYVKKLIKVYGIKKSDLADNIGLTRQGLDNLLNKKSFSLDDANKVLGVLNLSASIDIEPTESSIFLPEKVRGLLDTIEKKPESKKEEEMNYLILCENSEKLENVTNAFIRMLVDTGTCGSKDPVSASDDTKSIEFLAPNGCAYTFATRESNHKHKLMDAFEGMIISDSHMNQAIEAFYAPNDDIRTSYGRGLLIVLNLDTRENYMQRFPDWSSQPSTQGELA